MTLHKLHRMEIPKEWRDELATISAPTKETSWLHLIFEEGHPWEPVERLIVYQMYPEHMIPLDVWEQLAEYPPPSEMGNHYDVQQQQFINNPDCLITERAWHLFRETRCWGRPFWVIQGENGGHKRWFSNVEKQFLKLAGLPVDPPAPGDLPYAPFDQRVVKQLREHDLLRAEMGTLKSRKAIMGDIKDERTEAQERAFREKLVGWLKEQVAEAAEGVMESLMALDAPRADFDTKRMEEQSDIAMENFIRSGKSHKGRILVP